MSSSLMFFSAVDSNGQEGVWETDGTVAGTVEIATLSSQSNEPYDDFTSVNGVVLFAGSGPDAVNYLWVTDGTTQGTQPLTVANASRVEGLNPTDLTAIGNKVYFNGIDAAANYGLWVSDGTAAGTYEINGTSGLDPRHLTVFNGGLAFTSIQKGGVWTVSAGGAVSEIPGTSGLNPTQFAVIGAELYFANSPIAATNPYDLYESDDTAAGTKALGFVGQPVDLTAFNNELLFEAADSQNNENLYAYSGGAITEVSGSQAIFNNLQSAAEDGGAVSPDFTAYDGYVYFEADSAQGEFGLWRTDGSSATEIAPISGSASTGVFPSTGDPDFNGPDFDVFNGELYFDGVVAGGEEPSFGQTYLWKSNGAASGTSIVSGVKGAGYPGVLGFDPSAMATVTLPSTPAVTGVAFNIPDSSSEVSADSVYISGTVTPGAASKGVDIYNGSTLLGAATVSNGAFSLSATLSPGTYKDIYAAVVDAKGQTVDQLAPFAATVGVTGKPYDSLIDEYDANRDLTGQIYYSNGSVYLQDTIQSSFPNTAYSYNGGSYFEYVQFQQYSNYYTYGQFTGSTFLYPDGQGGSGGPSYYETIYSAGDAYIGLEYIYTSEGLSGVGADFTGEYLTTNPAGDAQRAEYTGFTDTPYSSLTVNYVEGVLASSDYLFASAPAGATYSSYEEIVSNTGAYAGADFFYTDLAGQSYTSEEADYNADDKLTRQVLTGFTDQPYYELELDYKAGVYSDYKAFYASTGAAYGGEEVEVSSAGALQSVTYFGLANSPYFSVEEDYASNALVRSIYDFINVSGQTYSAYQVTENAAGHQLQEVLDLNSGGHEQISFVTGRTLTSLGNDTMVGVSNGATTFDFQGVYGAGVIYNLDSSDQVIMPYAEFHTFQLMYAAAAPVQGADNVVITASDGDTLTLKNMTMSTLQSLQNNFSFT